MKINYFKKGKSRFSSFKCNFLSLSTIIYDSLMQKLQLEQRLAEQREVLRQETLEKLQLKREEFNKNLEMNKIKFEKERITSELEAKAKSELANEDLTIRRKYSHMTSSPSADDLNDFMLT